MKKVSYSMAAMNRKQCILCIIMTDRLRLIRYIELGENSVPIARSFESPITGKLLAYVWKVQNGSNGCSGLFGGLSAMTRRLKRI